jgi:hypothetical protein
MNPAADVSEGPEDPVLNLITSPIPGLLWHYTGFEGFRGIVNSKHIYATNLKYLNDKEEFEHGYSLARQLLLDLLPEEDADPPVVRQLVMGEFEGLFTQGPLSPETLSVFTASFTLHGDQLSQWGGYSRGSTGVSLGFDFSDVRAFTAPSSPVIFAPCVYSDAQKETVLRNAIASYLEHTLKHAMAIADMPTVLRSIDAIAKEKPDQSRERISDDYLKQALERSQKELPRIVGELSVNLLHLIGLLKHAAFEEEQEWRYLFPVFANMRRPPEQKFRARASTLVPYLEFPLVANDESKGFRLREVKLGPGSDEISAVPSVQAFLASVGLRDVKVSRSRIPYRSW